MSKFKTKGKKKWRIAELESWEQKQEVMAEKRNLQKKVIIEDDLTGERNSEKTLKDIASEKKEKSDDKVRVGYKKIYLKQEWYW